MAIKVVVNHRDGFEYGVQLNGKTPDILRDGQVLLLKNLRNDARLLQIGYFRRFDAEMDGEVRCDCGRDFATDEARYAHLPEHEVMRDAPVDHIVDERRVESEVLAARGMRSVSIAGAKSEQLIETSKKRCPVGCGRLIASQGMRAHVIACQGGGIKDVGLSHTAVAKHAAPKARAKKGTAVAA